MTTTNSISVIIPFYQTPEMDWKTPMLKECVNSFSGKVTEIIIMSGTEDSLPVAINKGFNVSSGDFIIVSNDDIRLLSPSVEDLCVAGTLTSPMLNGKTTGYHGHCFCIPRAFLEEGIRFDEAYEVAYFDDDDFAMQVEEKGFAIKGIPTVDVFHPPHGGTTLHEHKNRDAFYRKNEEYFKKKWNK